MQALAQYFEGVPFTSRKILLAAEENGDLACAVANALDMNAGAQGRAVQLGKLLALLLAPQPAGGLRGGTVVQGADGSKGLESVALDVRKDDYAALFYVFMRLRERFGGGRSRVEIFYKSPFDLKHGGIKMR